MLSRAADKWKAVTLPFKALLHETERLSRTRMSIDLLNKIKGSHLARDAGHLAVGQTFRLVIQAAYFVLIARILGPEQYGVFVAVVALAAILSPFSGLGTGNLFVKNVRSGRRTPEICWGNRLTTYSWFLVRS